MVSSVVQVVPILPFNLGLMLMASDEHIRVTSVTQVVKLVDRTRSPNSPTVNDCAAQSGAQFENKTCKSRRPVGSVTMTYRARRCHCLGPAFSAVVLFSSNYLISHRSRI